MPGFLPEFDLWEACIAAGGTLRDLQDVYEGKTFSSKFLAKVTAWYMLHCMVDMHKQAAVVSKMERDAGRKGAK